MKLSTICMVVLVPAWFAVTSAPAAAVDPSDMERLMDANQGSAPASQVHPVLPRIHAQTAGDSGVSVIGLLGIWSEARKTP